MSVKRKQAKDDRTGQGGGEGKEAHAGFEHNGRRANGVSDITAAARCDPRPDDLVVERGPIAVGVVETEEMDGDVALEAKEGGADAVDLLREAVMGKSGGDADTSYADVLIENFLRLLQAEPKKSLIPSMQTFNVASLINSTRV